MAVENDFEWFGTLTNGSGCSDREFFDRVRKKLSDYKRKTNPDFAYIILPDRSGENENRLHFHGIFKGIPPDELKKAISPYSGKPLLWYGEEVYNWFKFKDIGFTNFTKIRDLSKVSSYVAKYATKASWQLLLDCPRKCLHSAGLKEPLHEFKYMDEEFWLSYDMQKKSDVWCGANPFGYYLYIQKPLNEG